MNAISPGIWASLGEPMLTGALGRAGFDWICYDAQHGYFDDAAVCAALRMRQPGDAPVFVRVAANRPELIGRPLDAGADGVIVPMVEDSQQAQAAVSAARYPPVGTRSFGPMEPAPSSLSPLKRDVMCAVMVETAGALAVVDEIAAVPGLDMIFVGPFDLSLALGLDIEDMIADESPQAPLRRILQACGASGIKAGVYGGTPERAQRLARLGFDFVSVSTDRELLSDGVRITLQPFQSSAPHSETPQ